VIASVSLTSSRVGFGGVSRKRAGSRCSRSAIRAAPV
jgi:hypothetical protein